MHAPVPAIGAAPAGRAAARHDPRMRAAGPSAMPPQRKRKSDPPEAGRPVTVAVPLRVFSQLSVRLPADLAGRLKGFSLREGQSLNAIVATALERYLDQEEAGRPRE